MKNVSNTTTTNNEFKAEFKELWDSSVVEHAKNEMQKYSEDFAKTNQLHKGQVSQSGGYYIVVDNTKGERAIDEPFFFADYITRKHTYEVFAEAMKLGLEDFSIDFQWDTRYWESLRDKFKGYDPENDGDGDCVNILTYNTKDIKKREDAIKLNWATPDHLCEVIVEDGRKTRKGIFNYKAYTMLVALAKYSPNCHIGGRALYYLLDNGELDTKKHMLEMEGGFMTAILKGDLLLSLKRGSGNYVDALCEAIKKNEIEI